MLDKDGLSESDLARLVNELEALLRQRHDLLLYDRLINPEDHERLVRFLAFPQTAVSQLGTSIAAARESLTTRTDLGSAQRDLSLQELDSLSDRLSRMSRD